jgi:DNA-binding PadR family transcriptional regulator
MMDPRLLVLGLLKAAPMHGYALQQRMKQTQIDQWAGLQKGSIYHALKQLAAQGLLKARAGASSRVKAVYEVTARGRSELKRLLREAWAGPSAAFPTRLFGAIWFLQELGEPEILKALDGLEGRLEADLAHWKLEEQTLAASGQLPPHVRLVFDAARQHLETDLRLVQSLKLLLGAYGAVAKVT